MVKNYRKQNKKKQSPHYHSRAIQAAEPHYSTTLLTPQSRTHLYNQSAKPTIKRKLKQTQKKRKQKQVKRNKKNAENSQDGKNYEKNKRTENLPQKNTKNN